MPLIIPAMILMFSDIEMLPPAIQWIMLAIPYTHTMLATKAAFLGNYWLISGASPTSASSRSLCSGSQRRYSRRRGSSRRGSAASASLRERRPAGELTSTLRSTPSRRTLSSPSQTRASPASCSRGTRLSCNASGEGRLISPCII